MVPVASTCGTRSIQGVLFSGFAAAPPVPVAPAPPAPLPPTPRVALAPALPPVPFPVCPAPPATPPPSVLPAVPAPAAPAGPPLFPLARIDPLFVTLPWTKIRNPFGSSVTPLFTVRPVSQQSRVIVYSDPA